MKKMSAFFLAFLMLFSLSTNAFAVEEMPGTELAYSDVEGKVKLTENLNGGQKSTSVPRTEYDLSDGAYEANLELVGVAWLYTNYYFYCNSDGKIKVTYTIYSDTGRPTKMKVGLYDLEEKKIVTTWTSEESTLDGITESFNFINLDSTHRYAVAFTAVFDGLSHDSVHGTATIRH